MHFFSGFETVSNFIIAKIAKKINEFSVNVCNLTKVNKVKQKKDEKNHFFRKSS